MIVRHDKAARKNVRGCVRYSPAATKQKNDCNRRRARQHIRIIVSVKGYFRVHCAGSLNALLHATAAGELKKAEKSRCGQGEEMAIKDVKCHPTDKVIETEPSSKAQNSLTLNALVCVARREGDVRV
jgi:hypothetical protein